MLWSSPFSFDDSSFVRASLGAASGLPSLLRLHMFNDLLGLSLRLVFRYHIRWIEFALDFDNSH